MHKFRPLAERELLDATQWCLTDGGPAVAEQFESAVQRALRLLAFMPRLGSPSYPRRADLAVEAVSLDAGVPGEGRDDQRDRGGASEQGAGVLGGSAGAHRSKAVDDFWLKTRQALL
jgi:plasmid stabilization system protein ParE